MDVKISDPFGLAQDERMATIARTLEPLDAERQLYNRCIARSRRVARAKLVAITVLRHLSGRRCAIQFDFECDLPGAGTTSLQLIGKARTKGVDSPSYDLLQELWRTGFNDQAVDRIHVPEPMGIVPKFQMWVQGRVPGESAAEFLRGGESVKIARRIAEAAFKLHCSELNTSRSHILSDELHVVRERLSALAVKHPAQGATIGRVLAACMETGAAIPKPARLRSIHRDFSPEKVFINGEHTYIVDLDNYCNGDPAFDIGNFIGCAMASGDRADADALKALEERYVELAGEETREAIRAYARLSLARQSYAQSKEGADAAQLSRILDLCEKVMTLKA